MFVRGIKGNPTVVSVTEINTQSNAEKITEKSPRAVLTLQPQGWQQLLGQEGRESQGKKVRTDAVRKSRQEGRESHRKCWF